MTILDWIAIISLSVAILLLFFMLINLVIFFRMGAELKRITKIRTKNKKKRRRLNRKKKDLRKKKQKRMITVASFLFISVLCIMASAYTVYYQSTNLGKDDQNNIVMGYYYLSELEQQISNFEEEKSDGTKLSENLGTISMRLSAFTSKADYRINNDGQLLINRYYTSMKELGKVMFAEQQQLADSPEKLAELKLDVAKVREKEQKVLDTFKISKKSLEQK
ncbi:hypothetical protein [Candidatus Enterococcus mansonii]|uniref:Uncharacterized protein n=1 Tax=Candidatus Enterococcus mansonii TaxID=1834181 RepID=A0A242CIV0_9ENTE|nr:hypothetical protein [Enterococcus sp. 4G2_DIV0659]OTO09830.1 hypothetical protein A5880_000513 [Enterococcus sp. 4G2_DIV0659]